MRKMKREKIIIRTSVWGIVVNLLLVVFKAIVGLLANSIAIVLDALNNLTDALSSIVTIIGTKLAARAPDKEHPYGHGRIEYLTTLVVGIIVLAAGVMALVESVPKIFEPVETDYSLATIIIVSVAVVVKFSFGNYVKRVGQKINSGSLIASGADAIFDSLLSLSTLVGIIVNLLTGASLEGWLGTVIAIFIIRASLGMLKEAEVEILGRRPEREFSEKIKREVGKFRQVEGVYDLTLHNYGPLEIVGSAHVQVPDNLTAREIHKLSREITLKVYEKFGVILTIGIYAKNTSSDESRAIHRILLREVKKHSEILQVHGFYFDAETQEVAFDLVMDFECSNASKVQEQVVAKLKEKYPDYKYSVTMDADLSD